MSVYVYVDILYSLSVVKQIILLKININRVLDGRHAWTGRCWRTSHVVARHDYRAVPNWCAARGDRRYLTLSTP